MKKTGWLIYRKNDIKKNEFFINSFLEEGKKLGIKIQLLLSEKIDYGIKDSRFFLHYEGQSIPFPDFAICRTIDPLLSKHLEYMSIPVFNNAEVAEICNDKAKTYQAIAQLGIASVDTIFCRKDLAESKKRLFASGGQYVVKACAGHGGGQVFFPKGEEEYGAAVSQCKNDDMVIQEFAGMGNRDLRIYVLGKEILAAILRTGEKDFRSNYSLGGKVEVYPLSEQEKSIIRKITNAFDFGLVGIDFLIGKNGELIFNEIEDVVGSRMLYKCTNINLTKRYLQFIGGSH